MTPRAVEAHAGSLTEVLNRSDGLPDLEARFIHAYPKEYEGPKPITDQVKAIARIFDLDPSHALEFAKDLPALPDGAEGWFAIPRQKKIAPTYSKAVQEVRDLIKQTLNSKLYYSAEDRLCPRHLHQHAKTVKAFQKLGREQKGHDILVVAAQFGLRHRCRSIRRAREVMNASEFGLGAFAVGCMLLTHPKRLMNHDDLWIDCAGDEYSRNADGVFSHAPFFSFGGWSDGVDFVFGWNDLVLEYCGSASGFIVE